MLEQYDQFRHCLEKTHSKQFHILETTIALGDAFVAATNGRDTQGDLDRMLFIIFGRMYNSLSAAAILLRFGYGVEAGVLTRTFFEGFFNIRYILSQPDSVREVFAERFFAYQYAARYLTTVSMARAGEKLPKRAVMDARREWRERWVAKYGWDEGRPTLDWSGLSLGKKAEAGNAAAIYKQVNHYFSEMVHSGPDIWQHYVREDNGVNKFIIGPEDNKLIDFPIPVLMQAFCDSVYMLATLFDLSDLMDKAKGTLDAGRVVFNALQEGTKST